MLSLGDRIAGELGQGMLEQIYIKGGNGYIVLADIGGEAVLTVMARANAKLGLVFLETRRAVEDLQKLREVHSFLMEKFKEDISIIVRRTDERK